ncbi:hypothetical protein B5800_13095 [Gilliamella apicola]|nr:hypothetical protein B5800_13095 [Gilliamella apicola]ORF47422.1 hypothetical protein B5799_12670 [Gilliamella apicola]ORF51868.1 hypothetical protein B5798_12770 [Gilliamella apicola]ORF51886.1 hypothetical protein B5803_06040 [Gilliamella apicola]ORF53097.1 hypothetical protein B5802_09270 [Gilliamella apicola]
MWQSVLNNNAISIKVVFGTSNMIGGGL